MKNKSIVCACLSVFSAVFLLFPECPVFSQERDLPEQQLGIDRANISGFDSSPAPKPEKVLIDKEIKYTAGPDKVWFTDDDAVYEHYQIEHDGNGKILKSSRYTAGKDEAPYTYDDVLKDFQVFEYGLDGKLLKEFSYDGQKARKYDRISATVYTYDDKGRKVKRECSYPGKKETRSIVYSYDEAGHQIQGVEYWGENIEKYHRFEYDNSGKLTRAMEYLHDRDGKGADGIWFTPDDVVSSTKETFYNADDTKAEDNKYISAGPDGKWFTKDDEMQYYVLFEYQQRDLDVQSGKNIHPYNTD